ncbi:Crp/Fnr family transcriptional regulator [Pedobacter caeni]|uniref:cAMP-binding domain of CRP or a regulatory subunit of cAMP-dependent protein kinases n=1 Tax=Pedobacter caeni TaxID=288992 RepID=A0A1M4VQK8_9SPHI|nr:Crp/Fnr family transcriptional regulator [Pedobacter caeni]SHE71155.1 cAMP-binding domain of CRP or a regulatory subunit of cAMP-dependent protein kinases [Pedobacter caeni]
MFHPLFDHIHKYIPLDENEKQLITKKLKYLHLKKKEVVLAEGKVCQANYFIVKGCLRMCFFDDKGVEQTIQFAIENWWISDYTSLENGKPSGFQIQAVEASEVIAVEKAIQEGLFDEVPKLERYFRLMMQRGYSASQMRKKYDYTLSREEQYYHFSAAFPQFVQRIPQYMLASYLGFTPEFLSKIRAKGTRKIS